mmetsp:Transcript_3912/g.6107  ORF Transcript_3912/g.6107 Transcript_3912/m.6107 type:complete len:347 (+) Transcript_3912:20-1060(+)
MPLTFSPQTTVILAVLSYSFCSGSLVLVNKLILHHLPYPSLVITVQLLSTLLFIQIADAFHFIDVDPVRWKCVKPYLAYTVAFSLGVYCNMRSLSGANVETVIVFRALAPLFVSVLDALFLGREWPSARSWGALGLIALGAYGYALTDEQFQSQGMMAYMWPTLYLLVISFEMAYGKKIITGVDLHTKSGPVLYTNMLGWPPMLGFAAMGGEYGRLYEHMMDQSHIGDEGHLLPPAGLALLLLGCVVGTGIGYTGWWCRSKVSAASYTLIGVMNKCFTVLVNLLIWDQHAPVEGLVSLGLCIFGGVLYQQAPMKKCDKDCDSDKGGNELGGLVPLLRNNNVPTSGP